MLSPRKHLRKRGSKMKRIYYLGLWLTGFIVLLLMIMYGPKLKTVFMAVEQLPLAGHVIVLDPGHGGQDGGAVAKDEERTQEKDITLEIAKMLRVYLEQAGAIVYLTRETDKDLADPEMHGSSNRKSQDLRRRLQFIHEAEADLYLSIHLNSLPSSHWRGAQTFFYPSFEQNKQLATTIQNEFIRQLENTTRVPLQLNNIYLLKYTKVPGALVELGFLSNPEERELLKKKSYQQQLAASMYLGILRYVEAPLPEEEE